MKVLLSLTVLCLTLALAHGACFQALPTAQVKDGKLEKPDGCIDPFDNKLHPFGSEWNTAHCLHCNCKESELNCCTRFGGVAQIAGCKAVVDPETCKYTFYKENNPSELCPQQL